MELKDSEFGVVLSIDVLQSASGMGIFGGGGGCSSGCSGGSHGRVTNL